MKYLFMHTTHCTRQIYGYRQIYGKLPSASGKQTSLWTRRLVERLLEHGLLGQHAVLDRHDGDQVDEAGGVAPLVVVPRHELDEGRGEHDARAGVEGGRVGGADEVRRDDGVLGVADDALGVRLRRELDLGADRLVGGLLLELDDEVDDRHVDGRHAEGHAGQLARHDGVRLGDGLGGTGRRRDDVDAGGAARAPVALHRAVNGQLRGGRGVDGGHQALLDAELLVDDLDKRGQAVGRARRARDDSHRRVVLVLVDTNHQGRGLGVLARGGDDDVLGAALDVLHARLGGGERAGRLADVLDAGRLPRDLGREAGGGQRHLRAVDEEARIAVNRAGAQEEAVHGVVLEQVLHVLRSHRRVDVLEDERLAVDGNAHDLAADAAKAVGAELDQRVGAIRLGSASSLFTAPEDDAYGT